jgi:formylglycine-generating enzyme required for sulfatase activity
LNPDPSHFNGDFPVDNRRPEVDWCPVEGVSWFDAQEFCSRLSQRTGRTYTLPSESQWEYACRAGTTTPYAFGATISQWQANVASSGTTEVGRFRANAWGLYDMHGNVWEWCADHWHPNYLAAPDDGRSWTNPTAAEDEEMLLRGGSWSYYTMDCRSAARDHGQPGLASRSVGFRVVCLPQDPSLNP